MILRRRAAASAAVDAAHPNPALQTVEVKGSWGLRWVSQGVHKEAQVETPAPISPATPESTAPCALSLCCSSSSTASEVTTCCCTASLPNVDGLLQASLCSTRVGS